MFSPDDPDDPDDPGFKSGGARSGLLYSYHELAVCLTLSEPQSRCWGQTTQIPSSLSPKRDCGSKRVNAGDPEIHRQLLPRSIQAIIPAGPEVVQKQIGLFSYREPRVVLIGTRHVWYTAMVYQVPILGGSGLRPYSSSCHATSIAYLVEQS